MRSKTIIWTVLVCLSCKGRPSKPAEERHLAMVRHVGAQLFVDRLDNRVVLQSADTAGKTRFCSFRIGWRDSLLGADAQKRQDREKYVQYTMQQDWSAMVDGDTLRPVFFQEKAGLDPIMKEGAMVFEIPNGRRIDTLVYRDSFGDWGTQTFVLNGK